MVNGLSPAQCSHTSSSNQMSPTMIDDELFKPFLPALAHAFQSIAPERESELPRDLWVDLHVFPAEEFVAESVSGERLMRFSTAALELFWCVAHLNFVASAEYPRVQASGIDPWDLMAEKRTRDAVLLVKWSLDKIESKLPSVWPTGYPRPDLSAQPPSDIYFANELFLKAMAFVMHHERAHIELGHGVNSGSAALPYERAADKCATDWILGKAPTLEKLEARALGVASAILTIYRYEQHLATWDGSHPDPMDRIDRCLAAYVQDPDAKVYWLAAILVQVQGSIATRQRLMADAETFGGLLQEFQIVVSRASREFMRK